MPHTVGKLSTRDTTLLETSSQLEVCRENLWAPKVVGVPSLNVSPGTKNHLDVAPVERHKVYYKGEGGGFPQVWAAVSLVSPSCPWLVLTPKVLQLCTNHLVLVLCRSMWVVEACQFFLVPSQNSSMPFYPFKMLRTKERAPTPCSFVVFCLGFKFESFKELGACQEVVLKYRSVSPPYY
jgi:hypothetical protein